MAVQNREPIGCSFLATPHASLRVCKATPQTATTSAQKPQCVFQAREVDEREGTEVQAALLPLPEHLEAFSQCLERDLGALPFAELVERFLAVADVSPLYMLAQAKTVIRLAHFLEDIRLHPSAARRAFVRSRLS